MARRRKRGQRFDLADEVWRSREREGGGRMNRILIPATSQEQTHIGTATGLCHLQTKSTYILGEGRGPGPLCAVEIAQKSFHGVWITKPQKIEALPLALMREWSKV